MGMYMYLVETEYVALGLICSTGLCCILNISLDLFLVYAYTVEPVYSGHLWIMKKWPLQGGGFFMEVKMNEESSIGAHKGGPYREVAFLQGGYYRQVSLYLEMHVYSSLVYVKVYTPCRKVTQINT